MSHFSVIVIGPDIEAQLQPYHEFECTGTNDEYVVDVDLTEEIRAEYAEETQAFYDLPCGDRVTLEDGRLFREPTAEELATHRGPFYGSGFGGGNLPHMSRDWGDGLGLRAKIFDFMAAEATKVAVPVREGMTLLEFVEYQRGKQNLVGPDEVPDIGSEAADGSEERKGPAKYGYTRVDSAGEVVAVIDRTNPNKKWDYWRIGGRWSGHFPIKEDNTAPYLAPTAHWDAPEAASGTANQCTRAQLDIERSRSEAAAEASALFDKWERLVEEHGQAISWKEAREASDTLDAARLAYVSQPLINVAKRSESDGGFGPFFSNCFVDEFGYDRAAYIRKCENLVLVPYAVVKDGKWHAKGTMGWFGVSHGESGDGDWTEQFHRMLDDLPPDTLLTIVDCHI